MTATVATRALRLMTACVLALGLGACGDGTGTGTASGPRTSSAAPPAVRDGLPEVPASRLPAEARATLRLIEAGGPFPYRQDGTVFRNREGRLPARAGGYYLEYTVPTPGSRDRGARRIIAGKSGERYYTGDHYRSFARVVR
ncbi:ribonuclease domain-containing protein [Actinomadura macrotermitis]|uniref:Uncharacterized protein n=1 Tax=Actinomadura macrotermitis TaxID=2585200 RepID=A0A7K0BXF6_9ACTN|nr:ribonuclease domain-containing protein [Actinomadura macrotermitis]MQY05334.1 hypothetical protein [Actinomadura macrotermitis]